MLSLLKTASAGQKLVNHYISVSDQYLSETHETVQTQEMEHIRSTLVNTVGDGLVNDLDGAIETWVESRAWDAYEGTNSNAEYERELSDLAAQIAALLDGGCR